MKTRDFDFNLGTKFIPFSPAELRGRRREDGRMIVLDRLAGTIEHTGFRAIGDYLLPGDLLVLNDSYVVANKLFFLHGEHTVRLVLYGHEPDGTSIVGITSPDTLEPGLTLTSINDDRFVCRLLAPQSDRHWKVTFEPADRLIPVLEQHGQRVGQPFGPTSPPAGSNPDAPTPSFRTGVSPAPYRAVYARRPGSLQIPSAGLHFSEELLDQIAAKGVEVAHVTLHVGMAETLSARRISADDIENHEIKPEFYEVGDAAAAQINRAMAEKRRIVAVGTTVMRTLETLAIDGEPKAPVRAQAGWSDLYIYPGFRFNVVDALLTNLHQPRSSHIVLTAAFAGKDLVMRSYAEMLDMGTYEFDMYGDSMLIV